MTKTTNYEISKKLKEIGFDKETNFYFTEVAPDKFEAQYYTNNKEYLLLKSYDLETLLDALPKELNLFLGKTWLSLNLSNKSQSIGYGSEEEYAPEFYFIKEENESLADTAGRLLILLHEKNLIKF
jgi:hypothetical protein